MAVLRRVSAAEWLVPGVLTVYLCFSAGGFFPAEVALAALALALLLVLRVTLGEDPFAGFSRPLAVATGGLALLGVWQLASSAWSGAPARALLEFDRTLLYLLALVAFGCGSRSSERMRRLVWGLALALSLVAAVGLVSRLLPELWPTPPSVSNERLSYPLTYWNALGLVAGLATVLCLHLASSTREPRPARVLGAAAVPVLATTLYFTFSRGAIVAGALGLLAYMVVGRPRALVLGLIATVVPAALAVRAGYGAGLLATPEPTTAAAIVQGADVARTVGLAVLGAAILRTAMLPLDSRLARLEIARRSARLLTAAVVALALVVGVGGGLALDVPARAAESLERFVAGNSLEETGDTRDRLTQFGNNGRIYHWRVALEGFAERRVTGSGAGTYRMLWAQRRPSDFTVQDAHSLYLEVLAELGVVGIVLLATALVPILAALAIHARGRERAIYAAPLGAALAWAVHAGIDWDWEMPAVTVWLFCIGGVALAAPPGQGGLPAPSRRTRLLVSLGVALLALTPALLAVSERRLERSVDEFQAGRCPAAVDAALGSLSAVSVRSEPWEILGYCDVRLGSRRLAVQAMQNAVRRDPGNWQYHYGLALTRAAAGLDPRPQLRRARRLNPREDVLREASRRFDTASRRTWERRAVAARLPLIQ